jgi:aminopeptidase
MENKKKLCELLVDYSISVKLGEKVLIETFDVPQDFVKILVEKVLQSGGVPFMINHFWSVDKILLQNITQEVATKRQEHILSLMKDMDAYIGVRAKVNSFNIVDVDPAQVELEKKFFSKDILRERVNNTKWVILNYPTPSLAQQAGMSTDRFEEYFFEVCTYDWSQQLGKLEKLKEMLDNTDNVRIVGPDTDLSFSIKGINSVICAGKSNIPDGEIFTAPVKNSMNGVISYNIPSLYDGKRFDNVRFVVKDGKIVEATSSDTVGLNHILNQDEGARYFGEFALGINPMVTVPMLDILFDEKMAGSFHLTPGECYEEADNGNKSVIHWDLVCSQMPEYGGGEMYFDGKLVRKAGKFVFE